LRHEAFEHFFDEGLVEAHLKPLKHGKEASVHLFRANPRTTGEELVALKLYHPLDRRDFRDETLYRDGEFIKERRMRVELSGILQHIDRIQSLALDDVPPTTHVVEQENVLRDDEPRPGLSAEEALREAPEVIEGHFAVPKFE